MTDLVLDRLNKIYDDWIFREEKTIDKLGFFNTGYWKGVDDSIELAQINLIEKLLRFLTKKDGSILDVACGLGASTRFLTKYFDPKEIVGITPTEKQLEFCKTIAPRCTFKLMDATDLAFPDETFDNVLCMESAGHFVPRRKFFEEARRVLRRDGRLSLSDGLVLDTSSLLLDTSVSPESHPNYLPNLKAYRDMVKNAGFRYVRVEDTTEFAMDAFQCYLIRKLEDQYDRSPDPKVLEQMTLVSRSLDNSTTCCMVYAIK